jgi:hypothetical protein
MNERALGESRKKQPVLTGFQYGVMFPQYPNPSGWTSEVQGLLTTADGDRTLF